MHEVALAQNLREMILDNAAANGASTICSARLLLGELTCVDPETLAFAFDVACRGTTASGCRLDIVRIPLRLRCRGCGAEGASDPYSPCEMCGNAGFHVIQGREIRLDSIEIE